MQSLYIGEEPYYGFPVKRPLVPQDEVWVFKQWNGEYYIIRGRDEEDVSPRAPILQSHATIIHKFYRSASFTWTLTLFEKTTLLTSIETNVTLFVRDPVVFLEASQSAPNQQVAIASALDQALQSQLGKIFSGASGQGLSRDSAPPVLSQLQPETDISAYVQGLGEFNKLGLEVRIVVTLKVDPPLAYKRLVLKVAQESRIQEQLSQLKKHFQHEKSNLEEKHRHVKAGYDSASYHALLREELYRGQFGSFAPLLSKMKTPIEKIIQAEGVTTSQTSLSDLTTMIFYEVVWRTIEQVVPIARMHTSTSKAHAAQERAKQVQALYETMKQENWQYTPSNDKFREEVYIDIGGGSRFRLIVPKGYPDPKSPPAIVDMREGGTRVPQSQINSITRVALAGKADLPLLVQTVVDNLINGTTHIIQQNIPPTP